MVDSKKSLDTQSHPIPPPRDPFERFKTPWPQGDNDDHNPFIQFRRFADESFNSFFSGVPKFFSSIQQQQQSWQDDFQKQVEEHLKRSTEMEEGIRKQIEQNFEEMRQAFHRQEEEMKTDADKGRTPMPPWWQAGESKCPALKSVPSESMTRFRSASAEERNVETETDSTQQSNGPWWTRGNAAKCPALNADMSERAQKCPAMFDKAGNAKTELDAYEQAQAAPNANTVDTSPYAWSSGLGWDGKLKKSLEQAFEHNRRSWSRPKSLLTEDELSSPEIQNPNARVLPRRYTTWMNPFNQSHNTIPWLVLSPYSPVYLCNPEQPSALLARFTHSIEEPFSMSVMRYRDRSKLTSDVDKKMARALPWADAFEDLMSLEYNGTMIDRDASTFKTPKTWIHDMAKRGSLGPIWGFNDAGQLSQKQEFSPVLRVRAIKPKEVLDAVVEAQAQGTKDVMDEVRRLQNYEEKLYSPNCLDPTEAISLGAAQIASNTSGDEIRAIMQKLNPSLCDDLRRMGVEPVVFYFRVKAGKELRGKLNHEELTKAVWESLSVNALQNYQVELMLLELQNEKRLMMARQEQENDVNRDGALMPVGMTGAQFGEKPKVEDEGPVFEAVIHGEVEPEIPTESNRSSSSTTWSSHDTNKKDSLSIVSMMTRTETRTLSDGSVQTTRVLNRRFADGREETEENVNTTPPVSTPIEPLAVSEVDTVDKQAQASRPVQEALKEQQRKSGWFWN